MAKAKRNIGLEVLKGIREIKRGEHGRVTNVPAVASISEDTGLSQSRFAQLLGVSVRKLQEWEQGRRAHAAYDRRKKSSGITGRRLGRASAASPMGSRRGPRVRDDPVAASSPA